MQNSTSKLRVGILIFEGVEVLDFAGPYEVFSRVRTEPGTDSRRTEQSAPFEVYTVGRNTDVIHATGGLRVLPDYGLEDAPSADVLVIPGGFGTRPLLEDEPLLRWVRAQAEAARQVTSVCTGALVLAKLGLLRDRRATTHWGALDLLGTIDPSIDVQRETRVVHDGIVTSAGVAAGIDMAFSVVEEICGKQVADETAHYIEYPRDR